jgi:CheY-like chemotaxis protein
MGKKISDLHKVIFFRMVASNLFMAAKRESDQKDSKPYDVIILDLDMPILNGYDACR